MVLVSLPLPYLVLGYMFSPTLRIHLLPFFLQPLPSYVAAGLLIVPFRSLLYRRGVYGVFGLSLLVCCLVTGPSCKGVMSALGDACWIVWGSADGPGVPRSLFPGPPGSTFGRVSGSSYGGPLTTPSLCLAGPAPSWLFFRRRWCDVGGNVWWVMWYQFLHLVTLFTISEEN